MTLVKPTGYEKLWFLGGVAAGSGWLAVLTWLAPTWVSTAFILGAAVVGLAWMVAYGRDLAYEIRLEKLRKPACTCGVYEDCLKHGKGYD